MLYNSVLDSSSNWNLIVSSDCTDHLGLQEATRVIPRELHNTLGLENRSTIKDNCPEDR
jgi:hypothetical protein